MTGYITKDKCGTIYLYSEVPTKFDECWNNEYGDCIEIRPSDLPEGIIPEWEDEEPIKVRFHFEKDEPKDITQDIEDAVRSYPKDRSFNVTDLYDYWYETLSSLQLTPEQRAEWGKAMESAYKVGFNHGKKSCKA
jgi:hypothetical protein